MKVEGANSHLEMRFLNLGPFRDTTTVHISVEDVDEPPVFEPSFYFVEVPEDVEIGATIQIISAKDPDVTNNSIRSVFSSCVPQECFLIPLVDGLAMGLTQDRWEGLFLSSLLKSSVSLIKQDLILQGAWLKLAKQSRISPLLFLWHT